MSPAGGDRDRVALIALFAGAGAIAFAPIFVRLSELEPTATAFYRFLFAIPFLWLWRGAERRGAAETPIRAHGLRARAPLFLAGLFFAGDLGFWHWSIAHTSVANATLLANTAPVSWRSPAGWCSHKKRGRRSCSDWRWRWPAPRF